MTLRHFVFFVTAIDSAAVVAIFEFEALGPDAAAAMLSLVACVAAAMLALVACVVLVVAVDRLAIWGPSVAYFAPDHIDACTHARLQLG